MDRAGGCQGWAGPNRVLPLGVPDDRHRAGWAPWKRASLLGWAGRKRVHGMGGPGDRRAGAEAGCGRSPLLGSP